MGDTYNKPTSEKIYHGHGVWIPALKQQSGISIGVKYMLNYNFESITKEELQTLIDNQAVENLQLEFKCYNFANGKVPDKEKNDLLKEITSFANADGGLIIMGIDEEGKGVASKLMDIGCTLSEFDGIQLAIYQSSIRSW